MAIGSTGFATHNTTTPRKIEVTNGQSALVNWRYPNTNFKGVGVILPGNGTQLDRHRKEHIRNGINEKNQFMIDWDKDVCQTLIEAKNDINFQGHIVHGNLVNFSDMLWTFGFQIDLIDFDDTAYLEPYHINLLEKACQRDVKVFILALTTRGNPQGPGKYLLDWEKKLNIKRYPHHRGNLAISYGDIQAGAIEATAKKYGYDFYEERYRGRGHHTMVSCLIIKR